MICIVLLISDCTTNTKVLCSCNYAPKQFAGKIIVIIVHAVYTTLTDSMLQQ